MSLRVLEPGLCSLIVDHGRPRWRSLGIPLGGAADRSALALGNALLANPADAAALEITLVGPALVAEARVGCVVLGAPFQLSSNRQTLAPNKSFTLEPDEELHIGGTPFGARAYLCVAGGLQTPLILGSRSSLSPLERGDKLACAASAVPARFVRDELAWELVPALSKSLESSKHELRIIGGPQEDWFLAADGACPVALPAWGEFTVRRASNRMGLRLGGRVLPVPARELVSEPVCPGAIQVTRDGQAIVLGVDGQTIGGYPKIAQVISADLDALGQLRPGVVLTFARVGLETAQEVHLAREQRLAQWCLRLRLAASVF
jgi:biotin-dependent carboxylase-like uncharacterized protein